MDLTLLVLADAHFAADASHGSPIPSRMSSLGRELFRRAWEEARRIAKPDAVVVLGDFVDDGRAPGAVGDTEGMRDDLLRLGVPVLAVRGNHDIPIETFRSIFPERSLEAGGILLLAFDDSYDAADRSFRSPEGRAALETAYHEFPGRPIVTLQHNPVHTPIDSEYPYMLQNRIEVMEDYPRLGVILSLSGHYHPGQPLAREDGVAYATCPALCESPYRFLLARVRGRETSIEEISLSLGKADDAGFAVDDFHCHTEYAYCADGITAEGAIERAREFGIRRIHLTEHAGQLYLDARDYWNAAFLTDPDSCARERAAGRSRMPAYREWVRSLRSERVGLGLEVECDGWGRLTLVEEDRDGWDVLVGAVHYVPEMASSNPDPAVVAREFMEATEGLIRGGVDVLAHPFRLFPRARLPEPEELREPVVDLLAGSGTAAELNFHINAPDPEFFTRCVDRGVRIAFGGDSHRLSEVGALKPHVEFLHTIGAADRAEKTLYRGRG